MGSDMGYAEDAQARILVVDDDPAFGEMMAELLQHADERMAVVTADGGVGGLAHLADDSVDCVVAEYEMRAVDGLELFEAARKTDPAIGFLLLSIDRIVEVAHRIRSLAESAPGDPSGPSVATEP
ncbi:hypothetical protein BRC81_01700 [Halobacteriales archaeon QS_1_68_20]|nr:MAG: hypothetical protein BRC81_01700 [Halobacteriales archaeon QS_1_68_20]